MSQKVTLILTIVTVVLLAAAALFQLLEMRSFALFPILQERFFGKSAPAVSAPAKSPAPASAPADSSAPASAQGGLFPGKKAK